MKFYGAVMVTDNHPHPDTASEWVELTITQHARIVNTLLKNKENGSDVRMR
jgi:hypothetical protein